MKLKKILRKVYFGFWLIPATILYGVLFLIATPYLLISGTSMTYGWKTFWADFISCWVGSPNQ